MKLVATPPPPGEPPMSETLVRSRVTREDYRRMPEGPPYYELIHGELVPVPRPSREHNQVSNLLIEWWNPRARAERGELHSEPNLYLPGIEEVYHPDLAYLRAEERSLSRSEGIFGVPFVICEILSASTERKDRYVKMPDYRRAGVPHVWLINPRSPVAVEEHVLGDDGYYDLRAAIQAPGAWEPAAFPGWRISLGELDAAVAEIAE
jgi:Uma2 family endonuclease